MRIYNRALSDSEVLALAGAMLADPWPYATLLGMTSRVQDLNRDGLAENMTAAANSYFADFVALFQHTDSPTIQDERSVFDFNGNGQVDLADVVELFGALTA